jgi:5-methyltetrahydrofolate--homocysteine methyltransferase
VRARDTAFIRKEAVDQVAAGADCVDVNAGTSVAHELDDLKWLVETVQAAVEAPLCIDSANPEALRAALALAGRPAMVNSITGEKARMEAILPLVCESGSSVVALVMDDRGLPEDVKGRMSAAEILIPALEKAGVPREKIYVDPLVRPVSTDVRQGANVLETVRGVNRNWPGIHTICGLSNISFGLPARNALNAAFLVLMIEAGLDSAIIDPTEAHMMANIAAAEALVGRDEYCMNYITAHRSGRFAM